jgi:hypothetical protein
MMPTSDGAARRFVSLFGGAREHSDLVGIARAACREGYAVIAVKPRSKVPMCTLTDRQRKAADRVAANAAREAGSRHWEKVTHPCGRNHAITDPTEAERVFKRLVAAHPDLNIGLEVGASRLLVVDADTEAEMAAYTALLAQREDNPELVHAAPTVRSPGVLRVAGEDGEEIWTHKGGGHFWYLLPDGVDLTQAAAAPPLKLGLGEKKASLMFRDQLVLVPPSVRDEGPYTMASDIDVAPVWMVEDLRAHIAGKMLQVERSREKALRDDDPVEVWAAGVPWDTILTRYGWTTSGQTDSCGCEIWTRPGDWSSPKSATAHEAGCTTVPVTGGVLHLWTDNPPEELSGRKNWSKLQVVAAYEYGGNDRDAMRSLDLLREAPSGEPTIIRSHDLARLVEESTATGSPEDAAEDPADEPEDPAEDEHTSWWFLDLGPVLSGENPDPPPSVLVREDGQAAFYPGKVNGLIGPSESGKSWLALKAVAEELAADRPVLYLDFEDTASGIVSRLRFLGVPDEKMDPAAKLLFYVSPEEALHAVAYGDYAQMLIYRSWSLIVLDGVNAAMTLDGLDLISNKDITHFFNKVSKPAAMTGACVLTVDHVPKDPEAKSVGAIGGQAKRSTITGCSLRVDAVEPFGRGGSGKLTLTTDKDRPGYVRGASNAMKLWANVLVKSIGDDRLSMELDPAAEVTKSGVTNEQAHEYRIKVITYLKGIASEVSGRKIREEVTGSSAKVQDAINWLVENGYVGRRASPTNRSVHLNSYLRDYPSEGPTVIRTHDQDDPFEGIS